MQDYIASDVELLPLENSSEKIFHLCNFCGETLSLEQLEICEKFNSNPYCNFCLRSKINNFQQRILLLTFRHIFGYYHNAFYEHSQRIRALWLYDIDKIVQHHKVAGLKNPYFSYDDESMLWHISCDKTNVKIIQQTTLEIIRTLQLGKLAPRCSLTKLGTICSQSISKFAKGNNEERLICPDLANCNLFSADHRSLFNFRLRKIIQ